MSIQAAVCWATVELLHMYPVGVAAYPTTPQLSNLSCKAALLDDT